MRWKASVGVWLVSRVALLLMSLGASALPSGIQWRVSAVISGEMEIYQRWLESFQAGSFPAGDVMWQYPPAMALGVLAPGLLPFLSYSTAFAVLACAIDAVVFALLVRTGRRPGRRMTGAWVWTVGLPLLGPTPYARLDVMVTAVVVVTLLALPRSAKAGGVLAGLGALMKVWPALALVGTPPGRASRTAWSTALATVLGLSLALAMLLPGGFSFLTAQRDRGLQIESVGGLVFHIARHFGWRGDLTYSYGAMQFAGPHVATVASGMVTLNVLALGWLVLWRLRARTFTEATPAHAALAAVLLCVATSRVLSPQFMIWILGLAAVRATWQDPRQKLPIALILTATGLTAVLYPLFYADLIDGSTPFVAILLLRNGLLVAATLLVCRQLWRTTVTPVTPVTPRRSLGRQAGVDEAKGRGTGGASTPVTPVPPVTPATRRDRSDNPPARF